MCASSSVATECSRPVSNLAYSRSASEDAARANSRICRRFVASVATLSAVRPSEMRPASRSTPVTSDCSPIHSMTFGEIPREGRRAASMTSERAKPSGVTASRSHASAAATPVRLRKPPPSRTWTAMAPSTSAAWIGTSAELTRASTAISSERAPPSSSWRTISVVATSGYSTALMQRDPGDVSLLGPGLIDLSTRRRFRDSRFVAAATTGVGHR